MPVSAALAGQLRDLAAPAAVTTTTSTDQASGQTTRHVTKVIACDTLSWPARKVGTMRRSMGGALVHGTTPGPPLPAAGPRRLAAPARALTKSLPGLLLPGGQAFSGPGPTANGGREVNAELAGASG